MEEPGRDPAADHPGHNPEVGANEIQSECQQAHANDEKENVGPLTEQVQALKMGQAAAEENKQLEVLLSSTPPSGWSPGIALSNILWRQIKSLQSKERDLDERLAKQRVEQLVERVENEVEYEGALEEMCSQLRAEEEVLEANRREREWELERREVRLEEQVTGLREQVRKLEEELRMAQGGEPSKLDIEEAIQKLLGEVRAGNLELDEVSPSPSRAILLAFEDLLKESDERHEREKQALEETLRAKEEAEMSFRHERHKRRAREKQIESQMVAMHKEIGRLTSLLKERDHSLSVEKDRRVSAQEEALKLSAMLKDERVSHRVVMVKLKKLESFCSRLREKLARELSEKENEFLRNLEKDIGRLSAIFNLKKELPRPVEAEQFEAMRKQVEGLIGERDRAEEKINMLVKRSRDREAEIDAMWLERERLLIDKMSGLEEQVEQGEMKLRRCEESGAQEKASFEEEMRRACEEEKRAMEAMIGERDGWLREQDERLQSLLEAKEHEVLMLKTVQQKLLNTLAGYKREIQPGSGDDEAEPDVESFEKMASELEAELESRAREMKLREEAHEREAEKLSSERRELEEKVCETLSLMEELKSEIESKEKKMKWESEEMEALIAAKNEEIEGLKRELDEKDLELEIRVEKFQNEMQMIEQEIGKERREREKIMDSHFASKKLLASEAQLKEEFWERDMNRMIQELTSLRAELRKKAEELESLRLEACSRESERERLIGDQKEQAEELSRLRAEVAELQAAAQRSNSDSEFLGSESSVFEITEARRNAEWQFALGKVAVFDKQINEAMQAIQSLREELSAKEAELQKARSNNEPEMELARVEEQKVVEVLKVLECERSEASESISVLQGMIRELHWSLMRGGSKAGFESVEEMMVSSKKGEMVKVHASHLKEVDEFIRELQGRVEELEKMRSEKRPATRDEEIDEALMNVEREMLKFSPERRRAGVDESPRSRARLLASSSIDQPGSSSDRSWNLGGALSCVPVKDSIEHRWLPQEIPGQDPLALALPSRQQKKWIVDASWIEHVRKEHLLLTQQLALERQRVAALGQVEAENRWLEAMMLRAIQQKKEFELKLSQQKASSWGQGRSS